MGDPTTPPDPEQVSADAQTREAVKAITAGERLPAPKTWDELVRGVAVWLAIRWKDEEGTRHRCSVCGEDEWEWGPVVSFASDERWPTPPRGHGSFPYVQIGCQACGNTLLLNALAIFHPQQPPREP